MSEKYRRLDNQQILRLAENGCIAHNWDTVLVTDRTDISRLRGCIFSGHVRIGSTASMVVDNKGISRPAGIYNSTIIDSDIGDDCLIYNIGTYIANCNIGDRVIIENTGKLACTGPSLFGNGTPVSSINEAGGREVPIFNDLSAQTAYITAMYRHRPRAIERIEALIGEYCEGVRSDRCTIGDGAVISGCSSICNVNVGAGAVIEGAAQLSNGTVNSTPRQPSYIGTGVIAHDFICSEGSRLTDGVSISNCFVGEACRLEHGFMSTHSMFFANSELGGGEAASVFAGPYTVSHHRSSLLIAGYFLFFNAGSGSNQSNHLFKAGAVHQGIHERGCKFGSNSYIMLPSREGAFTVVIGKHTNHHDTSGLPFSYLIEDAGRSSLHPAANLRSYGTHRDLNKWPARDRRGEKRRDRIHQQEHNPYLGSKVLRALEICRRLASREGIETHNYNRIRIKHVVLKRGIQLYELAARAALGAALEGWDPATSDHAPAPLCREWIDAAGMYVPKERMDRILDELEQGRYGTIAELEAEFDRVYDEYPEYTYAWGLGMLAEELGREPSREDIARAIDEGREAAGTLTEQRTEDAQRDTDKMMETGYGIDCSDDEQRKADFRAVRKL